MLEDAGKGDSPKHEHRGPWEQETNYDGFPKVTDSNQGQCGLAGSR